MSPARGVTSRVISPGQFEVFTDPSDLRRVPEWRTKWERTWNIRSLDSCKVTGSIANVMLKLLNTMGTSLCQILPYGPCNGRILERVQITEADTAGRLHLYWSRSLSCYVVSDSVTNENVGDAWSTVLCTVEASSDGEAGPHVVACLHVVHAHEFTLHESRMACLALCCGCGLCCHESMHGIRHATGALSLPLTTHIQNDGAV